MTKFTFIFPICITLFFGCTAFDSSEMTAETPTAAAPVVEVQYDPPKATPEAAVVPPAVALETAPPAVLTTEEVRRLQIRLRDLRFDPGPVDGIAGMKTKAAFERLREGCAKLEPLDGKLPVAAAQTSKAKMAMEKHPSREETLRLQRELRSAGFNPGPADGIFGSRMKALVAQLQPGCSMVNDYSGRLAGPMLASNSEAIPSVAAGKDSGGAQPPRQARRVTPGNETSVQLPPPQEEIRILQLRLRDAGFDPGPFDGVMGPKTKLALKLYEASQRNSPTRTNLTTHISEQY